MRRRVFQIVVVHFITETACFNDIGHFPIVEIGLQDHRAIGIDMNRTEKLFTQLARSNNQLSSGCVHSLAQINHDVHRLARQTGEMICTSFFIRGFAIDQITLRQVFDIARESVRLVSCRNDGVSRTYLDRKCDWIARRFPRRQR